MSTTVPNQEPKIFLGTQSLKRKGKEMKINERKSLTCSIGYQKINPQNPNKLAYILVTLADG